MLVGGECAVGDIYTRFEVLAGHGGWVKAIGEASGGMAGN
jgi:hypothetical protein